MLRERRPLVHSHRCGFLLSHVWGMCAGCVRVAWLTQLYSLQGALVFLMQAGFAMLCAGSVRRTYK